MSAFGASACHQQRTGGSRLNQGLHCLELVIGAFSRYSRCVCVCVCVCVCLSVIISLCSGLFLCMVMQCIGFVGVLFSA